MTYLTSIIRLFVLPSPLLSRLKKFNIPSINFQSVLYTIFGIAKKFFYILTQNVGLYTKMFFVFIFVHKGYTNACIYT